MSEKTKKAAKKAPKKAAKKAPKRATKKAPATVRLNATTRGRPLVAGAVRNVVIETRFSRQEADAIVATARAQGVPYVSTWLRNTVLQQLPQRKGR